MTILRKLTMLCVLLVGACSTMPETALVTGSLSYRERIALPPDAKAEVTVSPVGPADAPAPAIVRQDVAVQGQVPLPFQIALPPGALKPDQRYALRAAIRSPQGTLLWTSDSATPLDPAQTRQDVGTVMLRQVPPPPKPPLAPAKPALQGYVARGNEPGWMLNITIHRLTLESDYGARKLEAAVPPRQKIAGGYRYTAHAGKQVIRVDVLSRTCRDDSGTPFPDTVTVTTGGKTLHGCGGDPAGALQHARWMVRSIDGQDVAPTSRPTLVFGITGRVTGHASCNSYSGPYQISGESGLRFGNLISTKRACEPALMRQEDSMLAVLNDAVRYALGDDGTLTIETGDGRRLVARKG